MPIIPGTFVHQGQIDSAVERAAAALEPDVVRIRYSLAEDWSGAASIFFRIVLSDNASREAHLREVVQRVERALNTEVRPEELGLQSYFNYRSVSEQAQLKEHAWS